MSTGSSNNFGFLLKREHFTQRGTLLNQWSKSVSEPIMLLKGSGYKGAACTSTSAVRSAFLDALSCITAAFSLKFSFCCQEDFLGFPFYLKTLPWATFELTIIHRKWKVLGLRHPFLLEKTVLTGMSWYWAVFHRIFCFLCAYPSNPYLRCFLSISTPVLQHLLVEREPLDFHGQLW